MISENQKEPKPQTIPIVLKPELYGIAVVATTLLPLLLIFYAWYSDWGFTYFPYWIPLFAAWSVYFVLSFRFVQTEELAGVTVLESPAFEQKEGLVFVPLFITELERFPRAVQQEQFPGPPERVSKLPDAEAERMRSDLLKPIRITSGKPEEGPGYEGDILNVRLTLEPTFTVDWQVEFDADKSDAGEESNDEGFFEFYINIPGKHWEEKYLNVLKRLRDTGERELNREMSRHSVSWIIAHKDELVDAVHTALIKSTRDWGILICGVSVLGLEPADHGTNQALTEVPKSISDRLAAINRAEGERQKLILEGEGLAAARRLKLAAEGEGLADAARALGMSGQDYWKGDVAKETIGEGTIIIGEDGITKAMAVGATILKGVNGNTKPNSAPEPKPEKGDSQ